MQGKHYYSFDDDWNEENDWRQDDNKMIPSTLNWEREKIEDSISTKSVSGEQKMEEKTKKKINTF